LLQELDKMEFFVYETQEVVKAKQRPIIIITSNNEKELPDAFLRRCFFHYIKFPTKTEMQQIIDVHHPNVKQELLAQSLDVFFELRDLQNIKKKPSTSELIDWLKLLIADDISQEVLMDNSNDVIPLFGALLKNEQDVSLIEKLAFMSRRKR
jgi:MoxR-like ATPase